MMTNEELYALCDALRYRVREVPLKSAPAAALPGGCIAVNSERIPNPAAEKEILAHELGHLETGSFPTGSPADLEGRHEERADRWAIRTLLPAPELCTALENGLVELYQLAEHFGVTEELVLRAFAYYREASALSLTPEEQAAAAVLRGYCPVSAAFRNGGEAARLLLPARLLDSLNDTRQPFAEERTSPSAPMWDFVRDGYHIFFDEILP